jgi:uncharacterized membrane protein YhaH (DUF805 family)
LRLCLVGLTTYNSSFDANRRAQMDWGNLLFGFQGRINRAKFWLAVLVYVVAAILAQIIGFASGSEAVTTLLSSVVGLANFVSGIFVGIKRLHDRDKSGWWLLLFYIAPGVLFGIGLAASVVGIMEGSSGAGGTAFVFLLASFAIWLWAFIELGCLRGTVGPNRYGPDPLAVRAPAAAH